MSSYKRKGGKSFNRKRKTKNDQVHKGELQFKEDGQEYAQVVKNFGDRRFEVFCFDGQTRIARVPGTFQNKVWIHRDDIILVSLRDFQDAKCDVIHKFTTKEARRLKAADHLPAKTRTGGIDPVDVEDDDDFVDFFEAVSEEEGEREFKATLKDDLVDFDVVPEEEEEDDENFTLDAL